MGSASAKAWPSDPSDRLAWALKVAEKLPQGY